jgi:hypothetical protein
MPSGRAKARRASAHRGDQVDVDAAIVIWHSDTGKLGAAVRAHATNPDTQSHNNFIAVTAKSP